MKRIEKYLILCCVAFSMLTIVSDIFGCFGINIFLNDKYSMAPAYALLIFLTTNKAVINE
jgi:hypothetical protein